MWNGAVAQGWKTTSKTRETDSEKEKEGTMRLLVLLAMCLFSLVIAHRAPDEAPNFPDGWCAHPGKPTKTTGECICVNSTCRGPKCRNESGFIYFAYADCPTCQCVPKDRNMEPVKAARPIVNSAPAEQLELDDEELPYPWIDYIHDNYDSFIGVIAAVLIFIMGTVFLLQILGLIVVDNNSAGPGEKTTSKVGLNENPAVVSKDSKAK